MEAKEAEKVCAQAAATLTQAISKTTNLNEISPLSRGLSAVASRMKDKEAAMVYYHSAAARIQAMSKTTYSEALRSNSEALLAVLADPVELKARKRIASVACIGLAPQPLELLLILPMLPELGDDPRPIPCRFSTPELVALLKHPLCAGPARRVILDLLEDRYQQRFVDHWDFVRYAEKQRLGLDFTTPPRRPEPAAR
jgi:hypothetical protein